MCVIIVKPENANSPSYNELKMASTIHPHGMGFASPSKSYRGFDFEKFYKQLQQVPNDEPCIIHFRYATHGSVCKENCHPFKKNGIWFAHNGILDIEPVGNMTDSQTAFELYIYPAIKQYGIHSLQVSSICMHLICGYSKFALLANGNIKLFGNFCKHQGRFYSNLRHLYYNGNTKTINYQVM